MTKRKLLAVVLVATMMAACTDEQRKKLAQGSDDLARGVNTLLALDQGLIKANLLSKDAALAITSGILDLNRIHGKLNTLAARYKPGDVASKQALVAGVGELAAAATDLNRTGSLHIKNPQSKAEFDAAMAVVQGAVAVFSGVIGGLK